MVGTDPMGERRNRLLHFKPSQTHVNLTVASVPLVVDIKNIRVDQLCAA